MTNPVGRPPGQGKVPGSGRKKGSLDRSARLLIGEQLAFDILKTYKKLGPDWLLKVAQDRPDLFINQCLSKLMPPAFKEDMGDGNTFNTQINYGDERGAALRVAFALNKAMHDNSLASPLAERVVDTPEPQEVPRWTPPTDAPDMPEPAEDLDRLRRVQEWAETLPLSADQKLVRETQTATIENYRGGPGEQPGSHTPVQRQSITRRPSVREIANRRRDELL